MIPIKTESQRVPRKTFRTLNDKPLAYWIVDALLGSKYDIDIWINTDSREVVDLYKEGGYDINFYIRPESVRGHAVSMNNVIRDWIDNVANYYDIYVQTHITNPFLTSDLIDETISREELYAQGSHTSVMGVTRHQCRMWHDNVPVNFKRGEVIQTQNLAPVYEDNSCIYVFDYPCFRQDGRVSLLPDMIEIPWPCNIDIDTEEEWELAQLVAEHII